MTTAFSSSSSSFRMFSSSMLFIALAVVVLSVSHICRGVDAKTISVPADAKVFLTAGDDVAVQCGQPLGGTPKLFSYNNGVQTKGTTVTLAAGNIAKFQCTQQFVADATGYKGGDAENRSTAPLGTFVPMSEAFNCKANAGDAFHVFCGPLAGTGGQNNNSGGGGNTSAAFTQKSGNNLNLLAGATVLVTAVVSFLF